MLLLKSIRRHQDRSIVPPTRGRDSYLRLCSPLLSLRIRVCHPNTRIYVRLLGPCFKTGGRQPFRLHREPTIWHSKSSIHLSHRQNFVLSRARANRHQGTNARKRGVTLLTRGQCRANRLNESEETHQPIRFLQRHPGVANSS